MTSTFGRLGQWSPIISQFIGVVSSANNWIPDAPDRSCFHSPLLLFPSFPPPELADKLNWKRALSTRPSFHFSLLFAGCPFRKPSHDQLDQPSNNRVDIALIANARDTASVLTLVCRTKFVRRLDRASRTSFPSKERWRGKRCNDWYSRWKGTGAGWCSFEFGQSRFV